jgi:hypothetical protein
MSSIAFSLINAASWRVATEITRRYPSLFIIESHPAIYDCLSIMDEDGKHYGSFNRLGSFHSFNHRRSAAEEDCKIKIWPMLIEEGSNKDILDTLCESMQLPTVAKLPPSTNRVKSYRFMADWIAIHAFSNRKEKYGKGYDIRDVKMHSRYIDPDEYFPQANKQIQAIDRGNSHDAKVLTRFWYLLKENKPLGLVDIEGYIWTRSGFEGKVTDCDIRKVR